eukprot:TRINITY_DN1096_c0_g1_i7.p2 TRINITY_DN1096_c0_g1~~TRINITY_DN1096_c0_g1_i7.p2  ORF type:complete len:206 (+),score=14.36 TRINITY_DN1096_c0_g1_i7:115-732(+)
MRRDGRVHPLGVRVQLGRPRPRAAVLAQSRPREGPPLLGGPRSVPFAVLIRHPPPAGPWSAGASWRAGVPSKWAPDAAACGAYGEDFDGRVLVRGDANHRPSCAACRVACEETAGCTVFVWGVSRAQRAVSGVLAKGRRRHGAQGGVGVPEEPLDERHRAANVLVAGGDGGEVGSSGRATASTAAGGIKKGGNGTVGGGAPAGVS